MTDVRIKKKDEVFITIVADDHILMELSDHFTFDSPKAKWSPAFKNKKWDGKIRLLHRKTGRIYGGLIHEVLDICKKSGYSVSIDKELFPDPVSNKDLDEFLSELENELPFKLRDYQIEIFKRCVKDKRAIALSPTGSGKSLIIYMLLRWYGGKALIIVPTVGLISQMIGDFKSYGYTGDMQQLGASATERRNSNLDIQVTTWQSLVELDSKFYSKFDVLIGDEVHGYDAKSLIKIVENSTQVPYRFGFSGTLKDAETHVLTLQGMFGRIHTATTTKKLMERGDLSPLKIKCIVLNYPKEFTRNIKIKTTYQEEIDLIVDLPKRNRFLTELVSSLKGNTLVLFNLIEKHGIPLFESISKNINKPSYLIYGGVEADERERVRSLVNSTKDGAIIVASYGTFSTGVNINNLHNIVFASPYKSKIRILQSIGRGLRLSDGKKHATLYDIVDNLDSASRESFATKHFVARCELYDSEKFDYKIYQVGFKP